MIALLYDAQQTGGAIVPANIIPFRVPRPSGFRVNHSASPGGAALHIVPGPVGCYLACNNASGGADKAMVLENGTEVTVVHNADPAANLGGKPLYAIEANDGLHTLLACVTFGGLAAGSVALIDTLYGAPIEVLIVDSIDAYVAVLFDDSKGIAADRLEGTFAGEADVTGTTSPRYAQYVEIIP